MRFAGASSLLAALESQRADREQRLGDRRLADRVDEMGVKHRHLVDFAAEEFLDAKFRDRLGLQNRRRILQLEIGQQFPLGPRDKLPRLPSGGHEDRLLDRKITGLAHQVGVQRAGQALVGADDQHQFLLHRSHLQQRMQQRIGPAFERNQHAVQQICE